MKKIFLLSSILIIQPAFSADLKIADFANKCSALFFLMTMMTDEQWEPFSDNMGQLSETMGLVTAGIAEKNNRTLTNGELINARNIEADKIIVMYKKSSLPVLELYARCDSFRENLAYTAMQYPDDDSLLFNSLSLPPKKVEMNEQKTALIEMVLETSFGEMNSAGITSIVEFYRKFKESLND